jgi:3-dehydroquinate synthase
MVTVPVSLGSRSYSIVIGDGLFAQAQALTAPFTKGRPVTIVTDSSVAQHQLPRFLAGIGPVPDPIILPAGEESKSWETLAFLCDALLTRGVERSDAIIALGGGVIGDLVGFAASIIKRGCQFIQVPTTLLAQVDSSVGGKTAINTTLGKNLVGAFHQPALVLIDPSVLDTLPLRHMRAGYAEIVKYGLINDPAFFAWCEKNGAALLSGDRAAQTYAIETSVRAKAAIVAADERETQDIRALLNLGHTFGHALEAETGFSNALFHGEGVALGMLLAHQFSERRGHCPAEDVARLQDHFETNGLPTTRQSVSISATGQQLVDHMLHDKKMAGGTLPFILSRGIGKAFVDKNVALTDVAAFLDDQGER